jgi:hypothetical protein
MTAAGAPSEIIQKVLNERSQEPEVQPCNVYIVSLFYRVCTQWVYAGMSGARVALNYSAVESRVNSMPGWSDLSVELKDKVWRGLLVIESTALAAWREQEG